jgi:hypothetical protein
MKVGTVRAGAWLALVLVCWSTAPLADQRTRKPPLHVCGASSNHGGDHGIAW